MIEDFNFGNGDFLQLKCKFVQEMQFEGYKLNPILEYNNMDNSNPTKTSCQVREEAPISSIVNLFRQNSLYMIPESIKIFFNGIQLNTRHTCEEVGLKSENTIVVKGDFFDCKPSSNVGVVFVLNPNLKYLIAVML